MPRGKKTDPAGVNKLQAVKEALTTLGKAAMPMDIEKFVKDKHGIDMLRSLISNYKHHLLGKSGGKKRRGRKPGRKPAAEAANVSKGGISIQDIEAVKAVVEKLGADKVRELARVLGK
jgi:hypothetical protein